MSRLTVELTDEQHHQVKTMAALQGKSIEQYVLDRLFSADAASAEREAWDELQDLLEERIETTEREGVSKRTIREITEGVLGEAAQ